MEPTRAPLRLLSCAPARPLADAVAARLGTAVLPSNDVWFACGEGKFTIEANVRGADVYVFQSVVAPADHGRSLYDRFIMLLHAIEAAALADADQITAVVPYYPAARQDKRKGRTREGISAGLFARMLETAGASRVLSFEVHNEAIGGMFSPRRCRLENVYLAHRLARWLQLNGLCGTIVAAPDVGGLERARHFAKELKVGLVALSKERDYSRTSTVKRTTLLGSVDGEDVLLVDDIIDTAGSVTAAVRELKTHGAQNITVACAHPVLSGPAWTRLAEVAAVAEREGWKFSVVGTSSILHESPPAWYHNYPLAHLLSRVIANINTRESVTGAQEADDPGQ